MRVPRAQARQGQGRPVLVREAAQGAAAVEGRQGQLQPGAAGPRGVARQLRARTAVGGLRCWALGWWLSGRSWAPTWPFAAWSTSSSMGSPLCGALCPSRWRCSRPPPRGCAPLLHLPSAGLQAPCSCTVLCCLLQSASCAPLQPAALPWQPDGDCALISVPLWVWCGADGGHGHAEQAEPRQRHGSCHGMLADWASPSGKAPSVDSEDGCFAPLPLFGPSASPRRQRSASPRRHRSASPRAEVVVESQLWCPCRRSLCRERWCLWASSGQGQTMLASLGCCATSPPTTTRTRHSSSVYGLRAWNPPSRHGPSGGLC